MLLNLYAVGMVVLGLWATFTFAGHALDLVLTPIVIIEGLGK